MITDTKTLRYLQNRHDPEKLYAENISAMWARDLWTLGDRVKEYAFGFSVTLGGKETTVVYNFDKASHPPGWGHCPVDLIQIQGYAWRTEEPIENIYTIEGDTLVYLLPRVTDGVGYIFYQNTENSMSRQNEINLQGAPYNDEDRAEPHASVITDRSMFSKGTYLQLNGPSDVWLDETESLHLISNVSSALGAEVTTFDVDYDLARGVDIYHLAVSVGDEDPVITTADIEITEEVALANIKAMSAIYLHLAGKRKKEGELYARVDAFRKQLKPNAKRFTPTKDLPKDSQQFQIDRFKRVTGWVEANQNKDKEEPTA